MVAEAILTFKNEGKCSFWAFSIQNFACGACNGYVTVRKRSVFVFCLGVGGPSDPGGGDPLNERSKTLRPASTGHARGAYVSVRERTNKARTAFLGCPLARVGGGCIEEHS